MPEQSRNKQEVLIVTGMSGAGRSTVGNALEDLDWYVVDNLPPQMLRPLVELADKAGANLPKIAAVVDVRGRDFFENLQEIIQSMPTPIAHQNTPSNPNGIATRPSRPAGITSAETTGIAARLASTP